MRKLVLCFFAIATFATASAQNFTWGVKAGANLSNLTKDASARSKVDFVGGVFGEYKLSNLIRLSADILYSGQGAKVANRESFVDLAYLNIPVLANFYVTDHLALKIGLQTGFLLGSKLRERPGVNSTIPTQITNKVDLAVPIGISYELNCGLLFDLRYNIGVTNVWDFSSSDILESQSNNSVLALTVGWRF